MQGKPICKGVSKGDAKAAMTVHYGACESLALMYREGALSTAPGGTCRGGARRISLSKRQRVPSHGHGLEGIQQDSGRFKELVQTRDRHGERSRRNSTPPFSKSSDNADCWNGDNNAPNSPFKQEDSRLDNNICTHPPGYWPRPNFCKDPNDEYCGLFGYDLKDLSNSVNDASRCPRMSRPDSIPRFS